MRSPWVGLAPTAGLRVEGRDMAHFPVGRRMIRQATLRLCSLRFLSDLRHCQKSHPKQSAFGLNYGAWLTLQSCVNTFCLLHPHRQHCGGSPTAPFGSVQKRELFRSLRPLMRGGLTLCKLWGVNPARTTCSVSPIHGVSQPFRCTRPLRSLASLHSAAKTVMG